MKISDSLSYERAVHEVYNLMNKGDKNITSKEAAVIKTMSKAIEYYEDHVLKIVPLQ